MVVLVKVNDLEVYALLNSGSTMVSIMHDFAQVTHLNIKQLETPVPLQLGTVGSHSMINFGARTRVELGPISSDAYMDVVNIDRYDMIIGTLFLREHRAVLDFGDDALVIQGRKITPLTVGQEDLMIAQRRARRTRTPAVSSGRLERKTH